MESLNRFTKRGELKLWEIPGSGSTMLGLGRAKL